MTHRILVTGSEGLIGRALCARLRESGHDVRGLDLAATGPDHGDTCNANTLEQAMRHVDGVVHLAAVSRVIWGEQHPERCERVNVGALKSLLHCAHRAAVRPWVIFASSREVYGEQEVLPVSEGRPLRPVNVYGATKVAGEQLIAAAAGCGLTACTVRLSNVYGCPRDHADRVVPAFTRAALWGSALRLEGGANVFDFTHVGDVVRGLEALVRLIIEERRSLPPIHLVSGKGTSLAELAASAVRLAGTDAPIHEARPRQFDVARFIGDPARASQLLGWRASTSLETGLSALMAALRASSTDVSGCRRPRTTG